MTSDVLILYTGAGDRFLAEVKVSFKNASFVRIAISMFAHELSCEDTILEVRS